LRSRTSTPSDVDLVVEAYIAGQQVPLTEEERNAALRRALFVFAAGGDLHRDPELADPAVAELARDLDTPERRSALLAASDVLSRLDDPELAWRAYACGLLADALGEDDDMSEQRFDGEPEEPGDPLEEQEEIDSSDGEPWAKTSSGDADDVSSD
jgi:hypothetical protein